MNAGFFRQTTLLFGVLAIGLALVLFGVKYEVQDVEEELARLDQDIANERRSIHVLRAEWAYLNNPDRLRGLAKAHLDLQPLAPEQLGSFASLPWPTPPAKAAVAIAPQPGFLTTPSTLSRWRTEP